ncbi:MAG: tRNA preQ1(34) S-adenosylmethionine ribosyltransferase-isomerase QueA [Armatimonadaceae bacterium]
MDSERKIADTFVEEKTSAGTTPVEEPVLLSEYDYVLPPERIAQEPVEPRDSSRLLVVPRFGDSFTHRFFRDLPELLRPDDLLVVNNTRVSAIRLWGNRRSGGNVEALLLRPIMDADGSPNTFAALIRPAKRVRIGDILEFADAGLSAEVAGVTPEGGRVLRFFPMESDATSQEANAEKSGGLAENTVFNRLEKAGRVPLPPYIEKPLENAERYQTVYAKTPGSAAAPTAGLHFTERLLEELRVRGVRIASVQLDVGLGTFRPIREDNVRHHEMHEETLVVSEETADAVNGCSGRVVAVGTTTLRALETAAIALEQSNPGAGGRRVPAFTGATRLFVYPGYSFRAVDALITNFHQPRSTLLLLVAAFAGRDTMRNAYQTALREPYRFLSFGDAMFIA